MDQSMKTIFCSSCGKSMTADKQFCTACGNSLNTTPAATAPHVALDPHVHHRVRPNRDRESFVNDLRDMGGRELAGLSFGAFAGASTGYFGGKQIVHTAFGFLKFLIFLFVVWVLFLFGVVPALMDGNWLPLLVWAIAGTPVWLTAVFVLNHASMRTALVCFSLCCILSIATISAYCKLEYQRASNRQESVASRPVQPQPPSPMMRRPARARHNISGSPVDVLRDDAVERDRAVGDALHQVDPPARRVHLLAPRDVRRTRRQTEPAVHAVREQRVVRTRPRLPRRIRLANICDVRHCS